MTEPLEVQIARLQQDVAALAKRIDENHANAEGKWSGINSQLVVLIRLADEWRGVRQALVAMGAILTIAAAVAGAAVNYIFHKS